MKLDLLPDSLHGLLCGLVEAWASPGMVIPDGTPKQARLRDLCVEAGPAFWQWGQIGRPMHPEPEPAAVKSPGKAVGLQPAAVAVPEPETLKPKREKPDDPA